VAAASAEWPPSGTKSGLPLGKPPDRLMTPLFPSLGKSCENASLLCVLADSGGPDSAANVLRNKARSESLYLR